MKKSLLLILACFFAVFMLAGCDDSSDDNTPALDPLPEISSLKGTYNIEFFYTDGGNAAVVTTDCNKVTEYVGSNVKQCSNSAQDTVDYQGKMTLDVLSDGSVKIISKIQMAGGAFENTPLGKVAKNKGANYQYTVYSIIPANAISSTKINDPATGKNVKGTTGRNAVALTSAKAQNSTYEFTYDATNDILINNIKDTSTGIVTANVVIRLKKEKETVDDLDANTPFDKPVIDNFNYDINYSENTTDNNLIGAYDISSLSLSGTAQNIDSNDFARINEDNNNLLLHLGVKELIDSVGNIYVYSEDPETLMKNGLTVSEKDGKTVVDFKLGELANIDMTRNLAYTTTQGIGAKQENISALINDNKNITTQTTAFDVAITHIGGGNKYYSFTFYSGVSEELGLPAGSYVGLSSAEVDDITFTSTPSECSTDSTKTTCNVKVEFAENSNFDATVPMIVLINEVDSNGANPTGVSTLGLLKLDVQ